MPKKSTKERAERDLREGKSASTAAGEFGKEEIDRIRRGEHGARNTKQAIAIGLSEARRAGIDPKLGKTASKRTRTKAAQDSARAGKKPSPTRSRASKKALQRESGEAASPEALSAHAKRAATRRKKAGGPTTPKRAAKRAAKTRKTASKSTRKTASKSTRTTASKSTRKAPARKRARKTA
jgi:hypothetical protein